MEDQSSFYLNEVTIRVWETREKIGHASLQTRNFPGNNAVKGISEEGTYVSIYPRLAKKDFKTKTLEQDLRKYETYPLEIILHSLNTSLIEEEYKRLVDAGFDFSILGSTFFKDPNTHNCCSLVFHLLKVGGIENLSEDFKLISLTTGTLVSHISLLTSYFLFTYKGLKPIVYGGHFGIIVGLLLSALSTEYDAFMRTLSSTICCMFGALFGSTFGVFLGYGWSCLEAILISEEKGNARLWEKMFNIFRFFSIEQVGLFSGIILLLSLAIAGCTYLYGAFSGKILRYVFGLREIVKYSYPPLSNLSISFLTKEKLYVISGSLLALRSLNLLNGTYNNTIDFIFHTAGIIGLNHGIHTLLHFGPFIVNSMKQQATENWGEFTSLVVQMLGESHYDKNIKMGLVIGALFSGIGCSVASSIGLSTMNFAAIKIKKTARLLLITPHDVADLIKAADVVEKNKRIKEESKEHDYFRKILFSARVTFYSFYHRKCSNGNRNNITTWLFPSLK